MQEFVLNCAVEREVPQTKARSPASMSERKTWRCGENVMVPPVSFNSDDISKFLICCPSVFQRKGRVSDKMLASPEGMLFYFSKNFSEDVKSSGGILLGDLDVDNKELQPELHFDCGMACYLRSQLSKIRHRPVSRSGGPFGFEYRIRVQ
jgi:hypothetical protein